MPASPEASLLADVVSDCVARFDLALRYTYVNAAVLLLTRLPAERILGKTNEEIGAPGELCALWRREAEAALAGAAREFEFDVERPSSVRHLQARLLPERDASGRVIGIVAVARELTDNRILPLLQAALARLPVGVALVEAPSGRALFRNDEASLIFRGDPKAGTVRGVADYGAFVGYKADGTPYAAEEWPAARSILHGEVVSAEEAEILRMDGSRGFIRMSSAPVRDETGAITAGLVTFHDVTASRRLDHDRAFLSRASALLGASLEPAETLRRLAGLAVPDLADWCLVHTWQGAEVVPVAVEHRDPARRRLAQEMAARYPVDRSAANVLGRVLAGGPAELIPEVTEEALVRVARDADHLRDLRELGFRSGMVTPIQGRAGVLGTLTFIAAESGRRYRPEDLALAEDLGRRAGMAIENARLFNAEREARRRSDLLRRVAEGLSGALTAADAARVVVTAARQAEGATASTVWLVDERTGTLVVVASDGHAVPPPAEFTSIPLDASLPVTDALRRHEPILLGSPEDLAARYPDLAGVGRGFKAWAVVPLLAHGRPLGVAALSFAEPRPFTADDASHLAAMGFQAAQAIARARLYEAEQAARATAETLHAETAVLYRLSDAANRAGSPEPVFEAALDAIRDLLGAARSSILLFDPAGVIRFVAWRGLSDEYRAAVTGHSPWSPDTRNPQAIVVPDVLEDAGLAAYRPVFEKERIRALAFIPLVYGNRLLGKFMIYGAGPRALDARELDRAGMIAAQVASAVGRAQAEDAMRDTNRRKDEFLAMLSHELRNPLAAARNAVHLLTTVAGDEAARGRWVDVIARQTGNLVRLVDELLDVSRITRGRIELQREDVDLRDTVKRALAAGAAVLAPHRVSVALPEDALMVDGDPVRLEQVVVNLLVNAGKYTPAPGDVSVEAVRVGGEIVLRVRDSGIGIEAERLTRVFELFDQGGRDLARAQGGLGIGLTIVRGILDLHGGTVVARSDGPGRGSEFVVRLPAAAVSAAAPPPRATPAFPGGTRRVLIVDDHVDSAEMLSVLLEAWGHAVSVVTDSAHALGRARDFRPDLVLLDIGLPGLSGYDVAAQLLGDDVARSAMLVALTGYGQPADRERAFASGFSDHMVKPVQPDALRDLLGRLPS